MKDNDHKHVAIMFTDIVGFTSLMGRDEKTALEKLRKNREIHSTFIKKYRGRLVKEVGDGMLLIFNLASDAVRCSIEIQESCIDQGIPLKIGIHEGEVVFEGTDVLGDGVNIASRLQEEADEGAIHISGAVFSDTKNKQGINASFINEKKFKNVDEAIKVYEITQEETKNRHNQNKSILTVLDEKKSIIVLPFVNISPDPNQEFFVDGLTEEIITDLSHVHDLLVISRNSSMTFKDSGLTTKQIVKKVNAHFLLEGSVRKAGNNIRISAQLIDGLHDTHIWAEKYNGKLNDVFSIQERMSQEIVKALKIKLQGQEQRTITRRYTQSLDAFNSYLKGKYYFNQLTAEGIKRAHEYFEKALKYDPNYSLAKVGLASIFGISSIYGSVPPKEAIPIAIAYCRKALEIDNNIAEAITALGYMEMTYNYNFNLAEILFERAISLNSNLVEAHINYSNYLTVTRKYKKAISEAERALDIDPLSNFNNTEIGLIYFYTGQFEKAIEHQQMVVSVSPTYFLAHFHLGLTYWGRSMMKEALKACKKAYDLSGGTHVTAAILACIYWEIGDKIQGELIFSDLMKKSQYEYVPATCFYIYNLIRNNNDEAFKWLKQAMEQRDFFLLWYITIPIKKLEVPVEPRFKKLVKDIGLS